MLRCFAIGLVSLLLALSGCESNSATVTGVVTLDGKTLDSGSVIFYPTGDGPSPAGGIGTDGKYSLKVGNSSEGIPPGEYIATVAAVAKEGLKPGETPPSIIPPKYMSKELSDLKFTIKVGSNTCDLNMKK